MLEIDLQSVKLFFLNDLPRKDAETKSRIVEEEGTNDSQGGGKKSIVQSNIIDIWTRFLPDLLLGLKLSRQIGTSPEASNLIVELYKKYESENEQQFRNAPNKFYVK